MKQLQEWLRKALGALLIGLAVSASAQITGVTGSPAPAAAGAAQAEPADPLGRSTPRGTIVAFMRAAEREDPSGAARYLQLTQSQRGNAESLARDLKDLMNRHFQQAVSSISDSPDGTLDDGLPIDRERIGPLLIGDREAEIILVRVKDPQAGRIWLISSDTLARIPVLRRSIAPTWIEEVMPEPLIDREAFGISLAEWTALAASLAIPLIVVALAGALAMRLAAMMVRDPAHRNTMASWYAALRLPSIAFVALLVHLTWTRSLGLPLTFRFAYGRLCGALAIVALAWLIRRVLVLGFARARSIVWGKDRANTRSLLQLGERVLQVMLVLAAVFAVLTVAGVDTRTALAGVGIGGVALALGAQKTVENLLGGVSLLSDKALAIGDLCSISNRVGWIEDITLRSVRLRTLDRSLVSIPAGTLAQAGIENFATREKILMQTLLRLRHGTRVQQIQSVLEGVRNLLETDARIEAASRIRLMDFGAQAIELELFAYVLTPDFGLFLAVREELLLKIGAIVEAAGTEFAQPTQFVYGPNDYLGATPVPPQPARDAASRKELRPPARADAVSDR